PHRDLLSFPTRRSSDLNSVAFSSVFETLLIQYVAGESQDPQFNFTPGPAVPIVFPAGSSELNFTLFGPGLSNAERAVQRGSEKQDRKSTRLNSSHSQIS